VHETPEDLSALQALLDRSYAAAGDHLRAIHTGPRRMTAVEVAGRLVGMRLIVLATVSGAGTPLTSPVDGVFHRGAFHFGTDPRSRRWQDLRWRPAVSATHLPSEDWAVVVHGRAEPVDPGPDGDGALRATLLEVYAPRYGAEWETFLDSGPVYARIDAHRMFAIDVTVGPGAVG
jgi:nitroimidazol reductase NimA-like FMN-containing flavoprotein (pyridoxamine 5'-phosphate oxidase superfamily)